MAPVAETSAPPIETDSLRVVYHPGLFREPKVALEGLDLRVETGEIFGFLGPNGAGKTSTIKCLLGLIEPASGTGRIFGADIRTVESRRNVGFLPENPYFYEYLTASEFLDFAARLSGMGRDERHRRAAEMLEMVGLAGEARTRLREFSKGMRQRIGLAQAFIHRPRLAVLDEPMSGLDPVGRREVREFIREMRSKGATIFFSSHILADVEALCDTVGVIHQGRLVTKGSLSKIISPKTLHLKVGVKGLRENDLAELGASDFHRDGDILAFSLPGEFPTARLLDLVRTRSAELLWLQPEREDLESAFMRLTGQTSFTEPSRTAASSEDDPDD